ncbi:hypothetical protein WA171_006246, partial [Blastocystis sp. BT1]
MEKKIIRVPWGREISFTTTTKLFIRHILHSCRDSNFPQYLVYKGKHLNYIEILGIVVRELTREQDKFVIVDDGTGLLECRIRSKVMLQSESVENLSFLNKCVRFTGVVEYCPFSQMAQTIDGEGDLCAAKLKVTAIRICEDANEEYLHWMDILKRECLLFPFS